MESETTPVLEAMDEAGSKIVRIPVADPYGVLPYGVSTSEEIDEVTLEAAASLRYIRRLQRQILKERAEKEALQAALDSAMDERDSLRERVAR